ncbi:thioredoxin-related transmembrane protein 1 isoform X2 [Hydra vulgaris]|uniref:Thioredoxin-related transmembrane protein 1 isoform X2 n=1 Tax=Hydra vulgaris TaxID=6087 RepID=A0ABM4C2K5_HYDVU
MFFFSLFLLLTCGKIAVKTLKIVEQKNFVFTEENWEKMLEGEWLVKFYAPWCPACRALETDWLQLANWADESFQSISIGSVDVTVHAGLNGRFMVTSLPTILHVINGEFRVYKESRELNKLKEFIIEKKWNEIEPTSSWTNPNSFLMNAMSKVFGLSVKLKDFHSTLNDEYNIPSWISFLLFGLIVIILGLLLGVALVILSDWVYPPETNIPDIIKKKNDDFVEADDGKPDIKEVDAELEETDNKIEENKVRQRKIEKTKVES